jgi:hypothetical protein
VDVETGEMRGLGERRAEIERYLDELKPHLPVRIHVARELPGEYLARLNQAPGLLP